MSMELSDEKYEMIMESLEKGDFLVDRGILKEALKKYIEALEHIPTPKNDYEIALHVYTALGDCYFNLKDFQNSCNNYNEALKCPDGLSHGYIWLGLGESYFELHEESKAQDALMSAYMLEGKEIFNGEEDKYFDLIKPGI